MQLDFLETVCEIFLPLSEPNCFIALSSELIGESPSKRIVQNTNLIYPLGPKVWTL